MDDTTIIAAASIISASTSTMGIGAVGPGMGQGRAVAGALSALAQQPDAASTITRTLFVGLAMIESMAIYCFVISMILIFANPFWNHAITVVVGKVSHANRLVHGCRASRSTSLFWSGC